MITTELVQHLFDYRDGKLYWKNSKRDGWNGKEAGNLQSNGYIVVKINNKLYKAHRVIWLWHGKELPEELDHINGCRHDNNMSNLRACNRFENAKNLKRPITNKTGFKNVILNNKNKNYNVVITANGKKMHIGAFKDLELAELVAIEARNKYHGEFATRENR